MSLKITHKYSTAAGTPPASGDIDVGEIAINAADAELYIKDSNGNIRKFQNTTTGTADGVRFTQAGTGAVQRTVESKLQDVVSVKDFGAVGDGVTDDTAAIQAALTAGAGGIVLLPKGTYKLLSGLNVSSNTCLLGYGATLDFSTAAAGSRVRLHGTVGTSYALTVNTTAGDTSVTVADTTGLSVGDLVRISSTDLVEAGDHGASTETIGELAIIDALTATTVTLKTSLRGSYLTADTAVAEKINAVENASVLGLIILGAGTPGTGSSSTEVGVSCTFCRNLTLRDLSVKYCDYQAISLDQAYAAVVDNCVIEHEDRQGHGIIQYGIALKGASESVKVVNNTIIGGKHGIVWTENSQPGINYGCIVANNTIINTWAGAITTHETTEDYQIIGNNIRSCVRGMDIRQPYGVISNNKIHIKDPAEATADGIYLSIVPHDIVISNNYIENARFGIRMYDSGIAATFKPSNIRVADNTIAGAEQQGVFLEQTQTTGPFSGIAIEGNDIRSCKGNSIRINGPFDAAVLANNTVSDPGAVAATQSVYLGSTTNCLIKGNSFFTSIAPLTNSGATGSHVIGNFFTHTSLGSGGSASYVSDNVQITSYDPLVIAAGVITAPLGKKYLRVDTEGAAATDDLDTINGGNLGDVVSFYSLSDFRDVTFKDGTGNLQLAGDFTLSDTDDVITLLKTGSGWQEISRSNNT